METIEGSSAAPEWVRALQAALHADMAADDSMAERRGEDDGDGDTDDFRSSFKSASDNRRDLGEDSDDEQNDVKKIIGTMLSSAKGRDEADRLHSATPPIPVDIPSVPPIGLDAKQQDRAPTLNEGPLQATDSSTQGEARSVDLPAPRHSLERASMSIKPKDAKKIIGSYGRLIINTKNLDTSKFSPKVSISVKDNFGRLFSRESGEATLMKKKLSRYITALQAEIVLVQKSVTVHSQHMAELALNLKDQELQLKRWALGHLFRTFQLQAWLRHSRCEFVVSIVKFISSVLQDKLEDSNHILRHISNKKSGKIEGAPSLLPPYDLASIDGYCLSPEAILLAEPQFVELHTRLMLLDKLCHRSLHKFRAKLPDLESKAQTDRMESLHALLSRYSAHMKNSQPLVKEGDRLTWDNFIIWSMKRQNEQNELEKEYLGFVEDERETEGRLFRRWCILMNPKFIENELNILAVPVDRDRLSSSQPPANSKNSFQGEAAFVNAELATLLAAAAENTTRQSTAPKSSDPAVLPAQKPDMVLSPRTVIAFIRYFSRDVIGKLYKVPVLSELEEALFALTEQLVFRRIGSVIFRYQRNGRTEKRDSSWRLKCSRCRLMDPVTSYGVAPEFLKKVENPGHTRDASGDLLLRPSRRRSSSGKRRRRSDSGHRSNPSPTQRVTSPSSSVICDDPVDISGSPRAEEVKKKMNVVSPTIPEGDIFHSENVDVVASDIVGDVDEPLQFGSDTIGDIESDDAISGPSFLKRVSAPLGDDLLTLLNTPAKSVSAVTNPEGAQSVGALKSLFSTAEASTMSPALTIDVPQNNSQVVAPAQGSPYPISGPGVLNTEQAKAFPMLTKSMSMDSSVDGKTERSGSFVHTVAMHCSGCDACRGRVCRPRLVADLVAVATPLRFIPTVYPPVNPVNVKATGGLSPRTGVVSASPLCAPAPPRRSSQVCGDGVYSIISGDRSKATFWHDNLKYAIPFKRTIRLLTSLSSCVCPRDMLFTLTWGMKWLHSDALDSTGKSEFLGADLMIPLLVMCLIHAKIPCIHLVMQFIRNYGSVDPCGESAYIMTCVEAAVAFIDRLEVSPELEADARGAYQSFDEQLTGAGLKRNCSRVKCLNDMFADESDLKSERLVLTPSNGNLSGMVDEDGVLRVSAGYAHQSDVKEIEEMAMEKLGEWLRDQKAMEDTIGILQQEGWMA